MSHISNDAICVRFDIYTLSSRLEMWKTLAEHPTWRVFKEKSCWLMGLVSYLCPGRGRWLTKLLPHFILTTMTAIWFQTEKGSNSPFIQSPHGHPSFNPTKSSVKVSGSVSRVALSLRMVCRSLGHTSTSEVMHTMAVLIPYIFCA